MGRNKPAEQQAVEQETDKLLKDFSLKHSNFDGCVYYSIDNGKILIIAAYVDDLLILSDDKTKNIKLKVDLMRHLKMKDLGETRCCLGVRIQHDIKMGVIAINQQKYIENLLTRF